MAARLLITTGVALVLTCAQLGVVAWMNHAEPKAAPVSSPAPLRVVAPPKRPKPKPTEPDLTPPPEQPSLRAPSPQPLAIVEPSALSDLPKTHTPTDHIAVLPGLSAGDLGPIGIGQISADVNVIPDTPARPLRRPPPSYPTSAKRRGIEGFVTVRLRVGETGNVISAIVVKAEPEGVFEDAAVRTARRYRFEPAIKDGKAAAATVEQRIVFRLRR